jgi:uncharacterized protein YndB with AHSA1/START domain
MKIDVLRYVGAVIREVQNREHEGRPARVVVASCTYDTTIQDLWDAISNPERIQRWFLPVTGELRLGGRYQLQGNAGGQITGCEPPSNLGLTWEFGAQVSWVHVKLTALSDGGTRLQLEHIAHVPEDFWKEYGPGAVGVGWDLSFVTLRKHLSTGAPVDPKEAAAWSASAEGREFIRHSSDGWRQASIASGTNEASAREAGNRTIAFYCGGK